MLPSSRGGQSSEVRSFAGHSKPFHQHLPQMWHSAIRADFQAILHSAGTPHLRTHKKGFSKARTDNSSLPDQEKLPNALAKPLYNILCSKGNMNHPNYLHCFPIKRLLLHPPHFLPFPLLRPSAGSDPNRLLCPASKEKGGWLFTLLMALPNVIWSDFRSCGEQKW